MSKFPRVFEKIANNHFLANLMTIFFGYIESREISTFTESYAALVFEYSTILFDAVPRVRYINVWYF